MELSVSSSYLDYHPWNSGFNGQSSSRCLSYSYISFSTCPETLPHQQLPYLAVFPLGAMAESAPHPGIDTVSSLQVLNIKTAFDMWKEAKQTSPMLMCYERVTMPVNSISWFKKCEVYLTVRICSQSFRVRVAWLALWKRLFALLYSLLLFHIFYILIAVPLPPLVSMGILAAV